MEESSPLYSGLVPLISAIRSRERGIQEREEVIIKWSPFYRGVVAEVEFVMTRSSSA